MSVCFFMLYVVFLLPLAISKITIHVFPHSHQDPGWINTYDEYYYNKVHKILTNTIQSLLNDKKRTFTYAEVSYFKRWYLSLNETVKQQVKDLIKEERFCFVNGGFVLEDEALSHYSDAINQLRVGFEFLKRELNLTMEIGWFLDQFGHSDSHAYIYQQMGFKYFILNRMTTKRKTALYDAKDLEFYWKPLSIDKEVFTHVIHDYFVPPKPLRNFTKDKKMTLKFEQLEKTANDFYKIVENAVKGYRHDHYVLYFGDDFVFKEQNVNFENIEMIMNYMNVNMSDKVIIKYSTPQKYFREIKKVLKPNKEKMLRYYGDFLPLIDFSIWTGFYTSRPYLKGKIRESSILLNSITKLAFDYLLRKSKTKNDVANFYKEHLYLQEAVALNQHHDAITGTAKTNVSNDYIEMLSYGEKNVSKYLIENALPDLFEHDKSYMQNITICISNNKVNLGCNVTLYDENSVNKTQWFILYNPGIDGDVLITMEFNYTSQMDYTYEITDHHSHKLLYDIYCIPQHKCMIYFFYKVDKMLSFVSFGISNNTMQYDNKNKQNECIGLSKVNEIKMFDNKITYNVMQNTFKTSVNDYNLSLSHGYLVGSSVEGAYILNPTSPNVTLYNISLNQSYYYQGQISNSILLRSTNTSLLIILFKEPFFIQTVSVIDRIEQRYPKSINLLLIINSNIINDNILYTDSAGMNIVNRTITQPIKKIGGEFYPICSNVIIQNTNDQNKRITVYNDRPEGTTTPHNGTLFILINRWTKTDDNKGVFEKLYEPQSTNQTLVLKHIVSLDLYNRTSNRMVRDIAENYFHEGLVLFTAGNMDHQSKVLNSKLHEIFYYPKNMKMTIAYVDKNRIIVQFFNLYNEFVYQKKASSIENTITILLNNVNFSLKKCKKNGFECKKVIYDYQNHGIHLRKHYYNNYINFTIEPFKFKVFEISFDI